MDQSIILLTYKGKVLLEHRDHVLETLKQNPWHFIVGQKEKNESSEETVYREVEKETSIQLKSIEFLGSLVHQSKRKYFYHTHLTDENVNNISCQQGKILGFFSLEELEKLSLIIPRKLLIQRQNVLKA